MSATTARITEDVRSKALRRPPPPSVSRFTPSVTRDSEISGLCLIATRRRAFWAFVYQPRGINPATGKRWGGGVRHELGDAMTMTVDEAGTAAILAKALVRQGGSPHHAAMASRASAEAARAIIPTTVAQALDLYERALTARRQLSPWTRKQSIRYARFAAADMSADTLPLAAINAPAIRVMLETTSGSDTRRWHIHGALNRFLKWCRKQGLIETNPCDALDRDDKPKPGAARDHVPSIAALRAIWAAAEGEPGCDLLRFLLLLPLRRSEAAGLRWSEVDFDQGRIRIVADRIKKGAAQLPLSPAARAILEARRATATGDLVFSTAAGGMFVNWDRPLARIRKKIDEDKKDRAARFTIHDIRRGFVSHLAGPFDVDLLDQCLGHTRRGVFGVYQRSARWPERVLALNAWADLILNVVKDSNVAPFQRRANV
jgi:integrase